MDEEIKVRQEVMEGVREVSRARTAEEARAKYVELGKAIEKWEQLTE